MGLKLLSPDWTRGTDWHSRNFVLQVEGRRMNMETIFFGKGKSASAGHQADWGRDMSRNKVIAAVNVENWIIFYVRTNGPDVLNFLQEVMQTGPQLGIKMAMPTQIALSDDKTETLIREMRKAVNPKVSRLFSFRAFSFSQNAA